MQVSSLADVIAVRKFSLFQDPQREVVIRMGRPQPSPEGEEEWFCPIQFVGIGDEKIRAIME